LTNGAIEKWFAARKGIQKHDAVDQAQYAANASRTSIAEYTRAATKLKQKQVDEETSGQATELWKSQINSKKILHNTKQASC
jgi:hypothetical protein